ncbi:Decaprenyl diphosphate synthase-like protein [Dactylonectria macrodidyma]|uniref:Alkyl transferase n=1 Tax=Dactylonectria macrodidyma TaxID=307937 RepID=A0A9P9F9P7_9HYPO|nr:Decaprenyl diphosphate synthase-like protein [Dactylonectria macrodidyma]
MSDATSSLLRRVILESPPGEWAMRQLRELLIGALKQGPIPQHVSFEMDGNRRYARSHRMETVEGHHHGFEALARIMEICYKCGVKVVTVYAFSIENFNRPKYEVEGLMQLAKVKLEQLTNYGHILDRYGARVRVLGQREMIRGDVLEVVDKAVARTKHNNKAVLNICFPYTSRAEMTTAVKSTVQEFLAPTPPKTTPFSPSRIRQKILSRQLDGRDGGLPTIHDDPPEELASLDEEGEKDSRDGDSSSPTLHPDSPSPRLRARNSSASLSGLPNPESITTETLDKHMYTANDPPLDIFVRTSGVERLSDFMLWQCHQDTQIFFIDTLWPDFDLQHFIWILLEWQWRQKQRDRDGAPTGGRALKTRSMAQ